MANVPAACAMVAEKYHAAGFPLSMDQLYYIVCALGYPRNDIHRSKFIGHVQEAVRLKLMRYTHLEPQGRSHTVELPKFSSVKEGLEALLKQYTVDRWKDSKYRPEVWVAAKSCVHTLSNVAFEYGVAVRSFPPVSKGHPSPSSIIAASAELLGSLGKSQSPVILYCVPYSKKLDDTEGTIVGHVRSVIKADVTFTKIGVTASQIKALSLIPNNINANAVYDVESIDPPILANMLRGTLRKYVDERKFKMAVAQENDDIRQLASIVDSVAVPT